MNFATKLILLLTLSFTSSALAKGKSRSKMSYPRIEAIQGEAVEVENLINIVNREPVKTEKVKNLKKGGVLKDKALLRTPVGGELWLQLDANSKLILNPQSLVDLPAITWKDGKVPEIRVLSGTVRYICEARCDRKIVTSLSESVPPVGDYLFSYDPKGPQVSLSVIAGEMAFRGIENENSVVLHAGESANFKGVIENSEPGFDVLLKGRRVAKGTLSEVQKMSASEIEKYQKQKENHKKAQAKIPKTGRLPSQICDRPWGELNQCVWTCEKNKKNAKECLVNQGAQCIRKRCNANGEWSDRTELSATESKCTIKPQVAACDY